MLYKPELGREVAAPISKQNQDEGNESDGMQTAQNALQHDEGSQVEKGSANPMTRMPIRIASVFCTFRADKTILTIWSRIRSVGTIIANSISGAAARTRRQVFLIILFPQVDAQKQGGIFPDTNQEYDDGLVDLEVDAWAAMEFS